MHPPLCDLPVGLRLARGGRRARGNQTGRSLKEHNFEGRIAITSADLQQSASVDLLSSSYGPSSTTNATAVSPS